MWNLGKRCTYPLRLNISFLDCKYLGVLVTRIYLLSAVLGLEPRASYMQASTLLQCYILYPGSQD